MIGSPLALALAPDAEGELAALVLELVAAVEDLGVVGDQRPAFARGDVLGELEAERAASPQRPTARPW